MHHLPVALTLSAVSLAGSVWWIPAAQTLRSGQDRPHSARLSAAACLAWWATGPLTALVLLLAPSSYAAAAAGLGALVAAALGLDAARARRREQRLQDRLWAELGEAAIVPDPARHRPALMAGTLVAVAAAVLTAATLLAAGNVTAAAFVATALVAAAAAAVAALTIQQRTSHDAAARAHAPEVVRAATVHPSQRGRLSR